MYSRNSGGPGIGNGGGAIQPISSLTPFIGNRWCIKGRVTDKGDVRTWNKPNSTGKLVSFTLIDESASIRTTMFNNAVDKFNNMLAPDCVYVVSGGQVKNANKRFSNVNNEYEVTLDENTTIEICRDVDKLIPHQRYNFVPIGVLNKREPNTMCDVLGVITQIQDVTKIVQKSTGAELVKRTIKISDKTASVDLTIWGDDAISFANPVGSVIAVKNVRIGTYDGCSLSTTQSSIDANPNISDTQDLSVWFQTTNGAGVESISGKREYEGGDNSSYRGRKYFDDIVSEGLGKGEKPDYIDVRCTPFYVRADNLHYEACPTCNKKVTSTDPSNPNAMWRCEKCNKEISHPEYRYMCSMNVSDNFATNWVTLFNEAGENFFGRKAKDLVLMDQHSIQQYLHGRLFQPVVMRMRVKEERMSPDEEDRMRLTATKVAFLSGGGDMQLIGTADYVAENRLITKILDSY
eukprot:Tbor_TRINITY_DN3683_c0_g1::TRINITY_DN3683_c0_g1_i1::g.262::m.262/K07466/RFA1, RPA1, rpa; replication factor A1